MCAAAAAVAAVPVPTAPAADASNHALPGTAVFDAYAAYYDLLYRDKDYAAEADFVLAQLSAHGGEVRRILEFGCGTGGHAAHFAASGVQVRGIDLGQRMVERALARAHGLPPDVAARLAFEVGDVRSVPAGPPVDAVVSLFHVASYLAEPGDLPRALATAHAHLREGGLLLFDFWWGPAVLNDPPVVRIRRLAGDGVHVTRTAEPRHVPEDKVVEVFYELWIETGREGGEGGRVANTRGAGPGAGIQRITETHRLRYWFGPELEALLSAAGFTTLGLYAWPGTQPPGPETWNAWAVARRA